MLFSKKKEVKKIVTHNGSFHADDVFATAVTMMHLDRNDFAYTVTRTRDKDLIANGDVVFDVGGIYDSTINRFDHHQPGGAGKRDNGIPYAAFGLVWKHYGPELCPNIEVWEDIDRRLAQPIDAIDNGMSISEPVECGLYEYGIHGIISACQNTWKEADQDQRQYECFMDLVGFFRKILERELERSVHRLEMVEIIKDAYQAAEDKQIIEVPYHVTIATLNHVLLPHPEVLYIICRSNKRWKVLAMRKDACSFENRKPLPESWAGLRDEALVKETGVEGAVFCHNGRFLCAVETKEEAHQLARIALDS